MSAEKKGPGRTRCFLALSLPKTAVSAMAALQDRLKKKRRNARPNARPKISRNINPNIKWTRPGNIHITLKFLGDITDDQQALVRTALSQAVRKAASFSLSARGLGFFPGVRTPRIIWTAFEGDARELIGFQGIMEKGLKEKGLTFSGAGQKPFKPHATLGRIKAKMPIRDAAALLEEGRSFQTPSFTCSDVVLFQSDLKKTGPVYTPLHIWRLADS
ncbi:putative RNA 2',3'-cyclic phosphodiesterase [Candidatus Desulfarcum epimagneticum]|uniref:RNA 2',3'-cyclic phosphodiesterase n=1 Tax=uncultured Desulfobacteraceae bacterium TaxID=218296 RepID=A0A484HHK3_9BACT|nr:putative RNA 2',3'-cyclic phosphodiesterase [uncultured Desulfobacteraceae bacterium]